MTDKQELRKLVRANIKQMYGWQKDYYSKQIIQKIENHPAFCSAHTVLLFWSLPDEVKTHDLITRWNGFKTILLPVVIGDDSEIRQFKNEAEMEEGAFHIDEPIGKAFTDYDKIDVAIIPGMAFDQQGNRLGRGKGYYDKLLKRIHCRKLAICFPCQIFSTIPHEEWDELVDEIISTEPVEVD